MAGISSSPEVGGKDKDRRKPAEEDGSARPRPNDDDRDPTADRGLLSGIEDSLGALDKDIRAAVGADPFQESFRPDRRAPNDEERPALKPAVAEEEEPVLLGDPLNLGARGNRRRTQNDVNASPVLRRGLLGV